MSIVNEAARARTLAAIKEAKRIGARRRQDISRDDMKNGELYAIFTYGPGQHEIHASLNSGMVWFYGPASQSNGAPCLLHEGYEPDTARWVADKALKVRAGLRDEPRA